MSFTITSFFGGLRITNTSVDNTSHTYQINYRTDCDNDTYTQITSGTLVAGEAYDLAYSADGRFQIAIDGSTDPFIALSYRNTLLNLLGDIEALLCGTNDACASCPDSTDYVLPILLRGISFFNLADSCYNFGLNVVANITDCDITKQLESEICKLKFGQTPDYTESAKKLAAVMYLGAYWMETIKSDTAQGTIDSFYNYNTVSSCITSLGFNLTTLKASFDTLTANCMCNNTYTNTNVGGVIYDPSTTTGASGDGVQPNNPTATDTTTVILGDNIQVTPELIANILQQWLAIEQTDETSESTYIYNAFEEILRNHFESGDTEILSQIFQSWATLVTEEITNEATTTTFTDIFETLLQQVTNNNQSIVTATGSIGYLILEGVKTVDNPCDTQGIFVIKGDAGTTKNIIFKKNGNDAVNITIAGITHPISTTNTEIAVEIPNTGFVTAAYTFSGTPGSGVANTDLVHILSGQDLIITSSFCYDTNSCATSTTPTVNSPTASFTTNAPLLSPGIVLQADASASTLVETYSWDFGDGTTTVTTTASDVSHIYAAAGNYTITLTVTSPQGLQASTTNLIRVNALPVPIITQDVSSGTAPLTVTLSGALSTDSDGTIVSYNWNIDGTSYTGETQTPTFTEAGTKLVQLVVVDNDGATQSASTTIAVTTAENVAPAVAGITHNASATVSDSVVYTANADSDSDGSVVSYTWDFGDGSQPITTATDNTTYTYGSVGTYTVSLFVTDNEGANSTVVTSTQEITAIPAGAPTAAILSSTPSGTTAPLTISYVASTADADNVNYNWDFGDGVGTATGISASYTWTTPGTYVTTLTVDNGAGLSATATETVTVLAASPTLVLTSPAGPTTLAEGDGLIFNALGSTTPSGTTITSFTFDPGDGTAATTQSGGLFTHTYNTIGSFVATVTVTNDQGQTDSENIAISVVANTITFATLTGKLTGPAGAQIILSVTTSGTGTPSGTANFRDVNSNLIGTASVTVSGGTGSGFGGGGGTGDVNTDTASTVITLSGAALYLDANHQPGGVDSNNDTTQVDVFQQSNGNLLGTINLSNNGNLTFTPTIP